MIAPARAASHANEPPPVAWQPQPAADGAGIIPASAPPPTPASGGTLPVWPVRSPALPKKRSSSTCPDTPGTVPVSEYCQNTAFVHGAGTLAHMLYVAMNSGYDASIESVNATSPNHAG